jgi:hypothetical protein
MTEKQKQGVKEAARKLYRDRRISLEMAIWAMKNAGYTREETVRLFEGSTGENDVCGNKANCQNGKH